MSPTRMSRIESGTRTVLDFHSAFNRHDLDVMADLLDENCLIETASPPPDGTVIKGREAIIEALKDKFEQSANLQLKIEEIFGMGFHVVMRWRQSGGELPLRGVEIIKVVDGLIIEIFSYIKGECAEILRE